MLLNMIDCLRDIGLDVECYTLGTSNDSMVHTRWSNTMAGLEYGRIYSWGNDPRRKVSRGFFLCFSVMIGGEHGLIF